MPTELEVAFPTLSEQDLAALAARGHARNVRAGEILFAAGDRGHCFYAVLKGSIEMDDLTHDEPRAGAVVRAGQLTVPLGMTAPLG